ncbi:hypothetical protein GN956_G21900 [Arapaima gigas]
MCKAALRRWGSCCGNRGVYKRCGSVSFWVLEERRHTGPVHTLHCSRIPRRPVVPGPAEAWSWQNVRSERRGSNNLGKQGKISEKMGAG